MKKAFKCKCGKSYRTAQKLRSHMIAQHSTTDLLKQSASAGQTHFTAAQVQSLQVRLRQDAMLRVLVFLCSLVKWPWSWCRVFLSIHLCLCVILHYNFKIENYLCTYSRNFFLYFGMCGSFRPFQALSADIKVVDLEILTLTPRWLVPGSRGFYKWILFSVWTKLSTDKNTAVFLRNNRIVAKCV